MTSSPTSRSSLRRGLAILFCATLTACGGSDDGGTTAAPPAPAPTPPPANQAPTASFNVAASAQAGTPIAFDANASTDPDGDALTYSWNFGDATLGGGPALAHIYTADGSFTATLTVSDGRGGVASTSRVIAVQPGPTPAGTVNTMAVVSDANGPLAGVTVNVVGGASATTVADGTTAVATALGVPLQLRFSKPGYADQMKQMTLAASSASGYIEARMLPREPALTLTDAAAGGTLTGKHGARVTIAPNSLVDANGNPVTGAVQIAMTPVDVGANTQAFPGLFQGITADGTMQVLLSYGTVEYVLTQNGQPVQLKPGSKATIELPIFTALHADGSPVTAGQTVPLWSLDERTSQWIQEGTGTVVAATGSPSELALRAEVGHFSWWNCDVGVNPYRPNTKCCIKDVPNGPCKENSGDICHHYGTGPNRPQNDNSLMAKLSSATARAQAIDPATLRIPASAAYTTAPAIAGAILPMPSNMDITVVSSARNGTYRGTRVFRGGPNVTEDVTVTVLPVGAGGNDDPITLPWNQTYSMQATGEIDRFKLAMPAGPGFDVRVSQAASSLTGTLKLIRPDGSTVAVDGFGQGDGALAVESTVATAGDYTIEITSATGAPGAYRLEAASLGTCSSVQPLTLPADHTDPIGQQQVRCYDFSLAADDVLRVVATTMSGQAHPGGSISLLTAGGAQHLLGRRFGGGSSFPERYFLTGVAQAGTYRLRVANETDNQGTLQLQITKPSAAVITVPGSTSVNVAPNAPDYTEPLVLIKPAANGLFDVRISATGITSGAELHPSQTPIPHNSARAARTPAPLLPVALAYSNAGSGPVIISAGTPTPFTLDTDVGGTVSDTPVVYALDATAGTEIAKARATPSGSVGVVFDFFAPNGTVLGGISSVEVLPRTGIYTALVQRVGQTGSASYTFRVNTAPPVVPLALTPPLTQQSADLPIGMARRYTFDLTQGEIVGLTLDTPGALTAQAVIAGVFDGFVETSQALTGPKSAASPPRFVRTTGPYTLTLKTSSSTLETASGSVTMGIYKPVPAPTALSTPFTVSIAANAWNAYGYTVPADGWFLLRLTSPPPQTASATVWASSSPFANYAGEFSESAKPEISNNPFDETTGRLLAGPHTLTVRNAIGTTPTTVTATLVALADPQPLAVGAGTSGAIGTLAERDYFTFDGVGGQTYTVRVTAGFTGTLRVRRIAPNNNPTIRGDQPLGTLGLSGFPTPLVSGVEKVATFTIPAAAPFGNGVYVIEVDADDTGTGSYTVNLSSP